MGSTSLLPEALIIAWSLSAYGTKDRGVNIQLSLPSFLLIHIKNFPEDGMRTVTSTQSSARMRAAYETASSELDIVVCRSVSGRYGRFLS